VRVVLPRVGVPRTDRAFRSISSIGGQSRTGSPRNAVIEDVISITRAPVHTGELVIGDWILGFGAAQGVGGCC
jgi:hypothetical protein